jgi:DNA-binding transcriptional LysR family regulator
MVDIGKLRAFIVVAEELNVRRAAETLAMSQPPLTRLIAALEEELDTKLFDRTTRSVALTGAGVLLLREARTIIAAVAGLETRVRAAGRMKAGSLRIGFSRTAFMASLPSIIESFQARFPKTKLELQEESGREVLKRVQDGRFDVGFVEGVSVADGLESGAIGAENLGALVARKNPLAKRKSISFDELRNETIILHHRRETAEFYDRISHLLEGMPDKPRVYIKGDSESCPVLVALGKGVALTIASAQNIAPEQTRFVPIRNMFLPLHVFWKAGNSAPQLQTFVSFAMESRAVVQQETECVAFDN